MPKLELGDLESIDALKSVNVPELARWVDEGWDIVAPVPSCVLMFKQELPLMYPEDEQVQKVRDGIFDPFEYLMLRHRAGLLRTDFARPAGQGELPRRVPPARAEPRTQDPRRAAARSGTQVEPIERCSGHNGTYGVKTEFRDISMKIGRPVVNRVQGAQADHYSSDCPMAGHQIESGLEKPAAPEHPLKLLRLAYGI
jgi:Fe-S oxidoreductase